MSLKSYYFVIEIYRRGQLNTIVEMEKLSRVASFLLKSEKNHVKTHYDCTVTVNLAYVSSKQIHCLDRFNAVDMDEIKRLALTA